jgi:hypothetical protein
MSVGRTRRLPLMVCHAAVIAGAQLPAARCQDEGRFGAYPSAGKQTAKPSDRMLS